MKFVHHKALDELHEALGKKIDLFMEAYIGRMKKQPLKKATITIKATTDAGDVEKYLDAEFAKIMSLSTKLDKYPELQNVLEEIATEIAKTLYICRMA
jgi:beta-phosphoglucomutase-like phosphatase (HAD superfamily)